MVWLKFTDISAAFTRDRIALPPSMQTPAEALNVLMKL
jgi:hypothetical protein